MLVTIMDVLWCNRESPYIWYNITIQLGKAKSKCFYTRGFVADLIGLEGHQTFSTGFDKITNPRD